MNSVKEQFCYFFTLPRMLPAFAGVRLPRMLPPGGGGLSLLGRLLSMLVNVFVTLSSVSCSCWSSSFFIVSRCFASASITFCVISSGIAAAKPRSYCDDENQYFCMISAAMVIVITEVGGFDLAFAFFFQSESFLLG